MKRLTLVILGAVMLCGCMAPKTFVKTMEPTWASVELRTDIAYEKAWAALYMLSENVFTQMVLYY